MAYLFKQFSTEVLRLEGQFKEHLNSLGYKPEQNSDEEAKQGEKQPFQKRFCATQVFKEHISEFNYRRIDSLRPTHRPYSNIRKFLNMCRSYCKDVPHKYQVELNYNEKVV